MSKSDDLLKRIRSLTEGNARPNNPPEPDASSRKSFLISFDNGKVSTDGMLDALRLGGYHARTNSRFPRTTIVCRTAITVPEKFILRTVSETLEDNGSATVAQIGADHVSVWPDQPWDTEKTKSWRRVSA